MNRTLMRRNANLGSQVSRVAATYIRLVEQSGRIRYHRIGGRRANNVGVEAQQTIARLAYAVCTLSPDAAGEILALPSTQVGKVVKAMLRRARKKAPKRGFFRRRPNGGVLRIRASDSTRGQSLAAG